MHGIVVALVFSREFFGLFSLITMTPRNTLYTA